MAAARSRGMFAGRRPRLDLGLRVGSCCRCVWCPAVRFAPSD